MENQNESTEPEPAAELEASAVDELVMPSTTITISEPTDLIGHNIVIETPDKRRWKRLVCWLLLRPRPTLRETLLVTETNGCTLTIAPYKIEA